MQNKRHIGLFGGSFNPVHSGHLLAAQSVLDQLKLDQVRFIPAAQSPFKSKPQVGDNHRRAMLELAISDNQKFKLELYELNQHAPSYSINTLKALVRQQPQNQYYLMIGMDAWLAFEQWLDWQQITDYCHIIVMTRPRYDKPQLSEAWQQRVFKALSQIKTAQQGRLVFVKVPTSKAASSDIRKRLKNQTSVVGLLPDAVARYIKQQKLY